MSKVAVGKLAIDGGQKLRTEPFHPWPVVDDEDVKAVAEVVASGKWGSLSGGGKVDEFIRRFTEFQQAQYGVCCVNGTAALEIALRACGVGRGDEVIVTPYTFIASASSILMVGGIPVFVDIDPESYNIDVTKIETAITDRTKAIMAVHIGGCPCDMDAIMEIAQRHNLRVIEDCAQAHGAAWRGRRVGAIGDAGAFSFQSSKNLNSGEGGIVVTNNKDIYDRAWSLHNVGRVPTGAWYEHPILGWNYRMTEFQGALLTSQMRRLPDQIAKREENAAYLNERLAQIPCVKPLKRDARVTTHAYHLYMFRYNPEVLGVPKSRFVSALAAEGIPAAGGYTPIYKEYAFALDLPGYPSYAKLALPVCERACADEAVWLFQSMLLGPKKDMDDIADAIEKVAENARELAA